MKIWSMGERLMGVDRRHVREAGLEPLAGEHCLRRGW
jgi:hypothetical protein